MKTHYYSAQELAAMKLPGMPVSKKGMIDLASRKKWAFKNRTGRGGGYEYAPPKAILELIRTAELNKIISATPNVAIATPDVAEVTAIAVPATAMAVIHPGGLTRKARKDADLTDTDRAQRDAALILCRAIDGARSAADCSARAAMLELSARITNGIAHPELVEAARVSYARPRASGQTEAALFSRLTKMYSAYEQGRKAGDVGLYLVPGKREKTGHHPLDVLAFLTFFCRPARPPVTEAWKHAAGWYAERGLTRPAVDTFYRIEKTLPVTIKYRGRVTGSEWRGLKPYIDRDVSMFKSNDVWVGDGHSFKAKVQSPQHGQPFTPEVTVIIDWVSRKVVGWSVSLSESTVAVSDAFRHAQLSTRARPLVYYSDNGAGQTSKMIDCPIAGTLSRQGIAHETGIPGNPQGRGIIERLWQVTLIPLARTYPTCTWRGADDNATTKMLKLLNRKDGGGIVVPSFGDFLRDVDACLKKYNQEHEHRELGGLAPEEAYQARLDRDSIVFGPSDAEIHALWMPEVVRKPQRNVISIFGNEYRPAVDLTQILPEGARVRVRYDLHHAEKVLLLDMEGRFLCHADWNAHKVAAFPVPEIDRLRENRVKGMVKRGEKIIERAQAELGNTYDMEPAQVMPIEQPDYMPAVEEEEEAPAMLSHEDFVMQFYREEEEEAETEPDFKDAAV